MIFSDHVMLVTGAAGNLGQAVARAFLGAGAHVIAADIDAGRLAGVFDADGDAVSQLAVDLSDAAQLHAAVAQTIGETGPIDVLCNIAGGFRMGEAVHETSDEAWDFLFGLNARSVLHAARAVVPGMVERGTGRIVNVGAGGTREGQALMGAYGASKAAVVHLTESMAKELGPLGINVNCVLPGIIDTPDNRAQMAAADFSPWVAPARIADVILFLSSPLADAVNGAAVPVFGRG